MSTVIFRRLATFETCRRTLGMSVRRGSPGGIAQIVFFQPLILLSDVGR
jgi:hypothetical protein